MKLALFLGAATLCAQTSTFKGMCDASGAVWVGSKLLVVNDEDSKDTLLRLFDPAGGGPSSSFKLPTSTLQFDPKEEEIDLEAITESGGLHWMIGSHSRNKNKLARWSRQNLIAFEWSASGPTKVRSITSLLPALGIRARGADKDLRVIDPERDPKDGGLSIEGLAATPSGDLLIGVRSPLATKGLALIARLVRPREVLDTNRALPNLDKIFLVSLGGAGVRDLLWDAKTSRYLILSGPVGPGGPFKIWAWKGGEDAPKELKDVTGDVPAGTAAEGLVRTHDGAGFLLLMDEGARPEGSGECKDLAEDKQSFHAVSIGDLP